MFNLNYSILSIIVIIGTSVVMFILLSIIRTYLPVVFKKFPKQKYKFKRWFYTIELFAIITILIIFISYVAEKNSIIAIVLMGLLLMAIYFVAVFIIKDYIVGLFIKSYGEYNLGDQIEVDGIKGRILQMSKTQLKIKDDAGNTIFIPYSWMKTKVKTVQQKTEKINGHTFYFKPKKKTWTESKSLEIIQFIKRLPWVHQAFEPSIEIEDDSEFRIKLTVYAFDKNFHSKIEQSVKTQFST